MQASPERKPPPKGPSHTGTLLVDRSQIHTRHVAPSHPVDCPLKDSRASRWPKLHIWSLCNDLHLDHWRSLGMVILGIPKVEETLQGRKFRKQSGWHQAFHYTHHIHLNNEDGRGSVLIFLMGYWGELWPASGCLATFSIEWFSVHRRTGCFVLEARRMRKHFVFPDTSYCNNCLAV